MLYGADAQWWHVHVPGFAGRRISIDDSCTIPSVEIWKQDRSQGLSFEPRTLKTGHGWTEGRIIAGGNSGYQAINLAVQLGFKRVMLLGYDMKRGPKGESHHHGNHPPPLNNPVDANFASWRMTFPEMKPDLERAGVEVINCTPGSALDCFPKMDLRDAL